jgi:hypothetical protein
MSATRSGKFCLWLVVGMGISALPAFTVPSNGQTIFPVARQFPPPMGLKFRGDWRCSDENSSAMLKVGSTNFAAGSSMKRLGSGWATVVESQEGQFGHFYVGYDRDHKQFVVIDADDPAYAAYQTDGWQDGKLTLTPINVAAQSTDRFVYEVKSSREFTVVWESLEGTTWIGGSRYTCRKLANVQPPNR